jgi:Protein of unknown function (DUF3618)
MDDTSRGVGDEKSRGIGEDAMQGRGEDSTRNYSQTTPGRSTRSGAVPDRPRSTPPGAADEGRSETGDEDTDRRTREIRAEIEQTREDMSETIDAIQEKLRPGNIVSDAKERVKNATTERVRQMVGSASETAQGAMEHTRHYAGDIVEGARHNAIPAAMIGAGLVWLLVDRFRGNGRDYGQRDYRSAYRTPRAYESEDYYRSGGTGYGATDAYDESEYGRYPDRSSSRNPAEGFNRASSRAGEAASHTRERMVRAGRRTRSQFERLLHDNPLLVGAAAMMVGAAVGIALPETERENELMGEAKDSMVERAQDLAKNAASRAQEAAGDMVGEVASRVVSGKESK